MPQGSSPGPPCFSAADGVVKRFVKTGFAKRALLTNPLLATPLTTSPVVKNFKHDRSCLTFGHAEERHPQTHPTYIEPLKSTNGKQIWPISAVAELANFGRCWPKLVESGTMSAQNSSTCSKVAGRQRRNRTKLLLEVTFAHLLSKFAVCVRRHVRRRAMWRVSVRHATAAARCGSRRSKCVVCLSSGRGPYPCAREVWFARAPHDAAQPADACRR